MAEETWKVEGRAELEQPRRRQRGYGSAGVNNEVQEVGWGRDCYIARTEEGGRLWRGRRSS